MWRSSILFLTSSQLEILRLFRKSRLFLNKGSRIFHDWLPYFGVGILKKKKTKAAKLVLFDWICTVLKMQFAISLHWNCNGNCTCCALWWEKITTYQWFLHLTSMFHFWLRGFKVLIIVQRGGQITRNGNNPTLVTTLHPSWLFWADSSPLGMQSCYSGWIIPITRYLAPPLYYIIGLRGK